MFSVVCNYSSLTINLKHNGITTLYFNYAAGGWQPWISNSLVEKLERVQNRGLRLITGQSMSSPCEALRAEAKVNSMRCVIRQNIAKSREKALRLPEDHR